MIGPPLRLPTFLIWLEGARMTSHWLNDEITIRFGAIAEILVGAPSGCGDAS